MSFLLNPLLGAEAATFPLRVAAIDIGSNAIRLLAAEFQSPRESAPLHYIREPIRLGRDAFRSRMIRPDVMAAAVQAIARFRKEMDELGIHGYRAVATSAVRDSRNGPEFVERVWSECGIRVETITGTEEAHLVWLALRDRVSLGTGKWVLVDLGGGSVEVSLIDAEQVEWSESHPLGTVRLLEELGDLSSESPARVRRRLEDHTAMLRISAAARELDAEGMIATGGNIEELAELAECQPDANGVRRLTLGRLRAVMDKLGRLSPKERVKELGLREDRADVILPAAVVYERIARLVSADEIVVPGVGVKDGLLVDAIEDIIEHGGHEARLDREAVAGAIALGQRYEYEAAHAAQVARLALSLFDQVAGLHGLAEGERRMLAVAALLHDVGQFISYRRHHKHSYYLIKNAELPAFTPQQIHLIALVARYHRRSEPEADHEGYSELSKVERTVVDRLASLLRIADALDREHEQQVANVVATIEGGDKLVLSLEGPGDLLPEKWALQRKAEMFERIFGLKVRVLTPEEATK